MVQKLLQNPVVVFVCVLFLLIFGIISLRGMPYALMPNITKTTISVRTLWPGATPYEIEREVAQKQEKHLKNIPGLLSMSANIKEGSVDITLEFDRRVDMKRAVMDVSANLSEIHSYPSNVGRAVIKTSSSNIPPAVYLFVRTLSNEPIGHAYDYLSESVVKLYERLDGVGDVILVGGMKKRVEIVVDVRQMAFYQVTMDQVINALQNSNINVSAGSISYGQRDYKIRTVGMYSRIDDIYSTVIKPHDTQPVYLSHIAHIISTHQMPSVPNIHNNDEVISLYIRPSYNANLLDLISKVRELTDSLNSGILRDHGLHIDWGRDSSGFIKDALWLVKSNMAIGILLSSLVLYLFLRNIYSVLIVSSIIPISILASFIVLHSLGRSLNVILLAGISFAISMIVDSSIIVVENIHRHHSMGKSVFRSCVDGTQEVIGALFASTITTVAIFIPVIGLDDEIGQLFSDIALASSSSLGISLIICVFVIPTAHYTLAKLLSGKQNLHLLPDRNVGSSMLVFNISKRISNIISAAGGFCFERICLLLHMIIRDARIRIMCIFGFMLLSVCVSYILFPKIDYLPRGKQNFLVAFVQASNGLSYEEKHDILKQIHSRHSHFMSVNGYDGAGKYPAIKDFHMSMQPGNVRLYNVSSDPSRASELIPLMQETIDSIPNISGQAIQQGIFDIRGISDSLNINIIGFDLTQMKSDAKAFMDLSKEHLPGIRIRSIPNLNPGNREMNLYPDSRVLAVNGLSVKSFGNILSVMVSGKKVGEFRSPEGHTIDMILRTGNDAQSPEDMLNSPIYTPSGRVLPLSSLATLRQDVGASNIVHYEQDRAILLKLHPVGRMSGQEVLDTIRDKILPKLKSDGHFKHASVDIDRGVSKIDLLSSELKRGLLLALVITYLLLSALYGNFLYPLVIICTVPFALAGGVMGLRFVNLLVASQNLDILTIIGFIILVGSVVNNAILIVSQSLINSKGGMSVYDSVYHATSSRIRPIFMSMLTSLLALAPFVFSIGVGSEIYRGLGAVIAGGVLFSTVVSVFVIPSLLMFVLKSRDDNVL